MLRIRNCEHFVKLITAFHGRHLNYPPEGVGIVEREVKNEGERKKRYCTMDGLTMGPIKSGYSPSILRQWKLSIMAKWYKNRW